MIIYKIQNKINDKIYIGKTIRNLNERISEHLVMNSHIGYALRKYGLQCFDISIVDTAETKEWLNDKEMEYIALYNCRYPNGYNLTDGGEGGVGTSGWKHSEQSKIKMRKPRSEQAKQNMRKPRENKNNKMGRHKRTEDILQKMRKPRSEQAKQNMRKPHKKGPLSKEHIENIKKAKIGQKYKMTEQGLKNISAGGQKRRKARNSLF